MKKFQILLHRKQFDMFDFHHKKGATILNYNESNRLEYITNCLKRYELKMEAQRVLEKKSEKRKSHEPKQQRAKE